MQRKVIDIINEAQKEAGININENIKGIICDYFKNYYPNNEIKDKICCNKKVKQFNYFDRKRNNGILLVDVQDDLIIIEANHRVNGRIIKIKEDFVVIKEEIKDIMNKYVVYEKNVCFTKSGGIVTLSGPDIQGMNNLCQINFYYDLLKNELVVLGEDICYKDNDISIENMHNVMYKKSC